MTPFASHLLLWGTFWIVVTFAWARHHKLSIWAPDADDATDDFSDGLETLARVHHTVVAR